MSLHSKGGRAENRLFNGDSESNSTRDEQSEAAVFPAADSHVKQHSEEQENAKGSGDVTLEDMYNSNYEFEDDEDDDSDWEPSSQAQDVFEITKWFCVNCTMDNFGKGVHCEVEMKSRPHAERPDRLQAIAASLAATGIFPGRCSPILARQITREELGMVHSLENIDAVELTSHLYSSYFTPDTYANQYSACAARLTAGLCFDLATSIYSGSAKNGFALVRPGHHACVKQAMGFCLHNNAAIAASAAQRAEQRRSWSLTGMFIMAMEPKKYLRKTNRFCMYLCKDMRVESFILVLELLLSRRTVVEEKEKMLDGSDLVSMGTQEVALSSLVQEFLSYPF